MTTVTVQVTDLACDVITRSLAGRKQLSHDGVRWVDENETVEDWVKRVVREAVRNLANGSDHAAVKAFQERIEAERRSFDASLLGS